MTYSDMKNKAFQVENIVANKDVSSQTFDQVELASDRSVNLLSLVVFSWKKEGKLCKLSRLML